MRVKEERGVKRKTREKRQIQDTSLSTLYYWLCLLQCCSHYEIIITKIERRGKREKKGREKDERRKGG